MVVNGCLVSQKALVIIGRHEIKEDLMAVFGNFLSRLCPHEVFKFDELLRVRGRRDSRGLYMPLS